MCYIYQAYFEALFAYIVAFKYNVITSVEMEGSSVGHVAFINKTPFVVIRCISDHADENSTHTYDDFEDKAGELSSSIIIEMMKIAT
ncbi:hypothetical protein [Bacillus pinisoli]|uniref:phosphorylase family protein n=1 Tax=Bacillus pinisoli TaxID=2901866 RepID=UPI001FF655EE